MVDSQASEHARAEARERLLTQITGHNHLALVIVDDLRIVLGVPGSSKPKGSTPTRIR